ncbi:MAG: hypothetical protein V1792_26075 [Pseudomonadota bacterium]
MHEHSTRSSRDGKGVTVLKPLLMITVFMVLSATVLLMMEALGSGTSRTDWSWVFYVGGAVALFVVLTLRARRKGDLRDETGQVDLDELQTGHDEETGEAPDDIRSRIRRRKMEKRSGVRNGVERE